MEKLDSLGDGVGDDRTSVTEEDYLYGLLVKHSKKGLHAVACIALEEIEKIKKHCLSEVMIQLKQVNIEKASTLTNWPPANIKHR